MHIEEREALNFAEIYLAISLVAGAILKNEMEPATYAVLDRISREAATKSDAFGRRTAEIHAMELACATQEPATPTNFR